ncbi:conserved hypothetical protein [Roseibium sp. TrichSKD4]|uniref:hypothetical protein n=1 Tax=Roseibium sp. TrichSKD4 TaxID=744980 RepID=UPI0001E57586|nr:hypothetical protein [Roseibium sp. TrichSKD4]EFO29987.1 conserved hypothetical protein [Roseibium sp. TrichSKD4]
MRWFVLNVIAGVFLMLLGAVSQAGNVEIVGAEARETGETWRFAVTLKHADTGWDHYADLWQVVAPDGTLLGKRVLAHPHVNEQPFTRSLSGVVIPSEVDHVFIRARDSKHGMAEEMYRLNLK